MAKLFHIVVKMAAMNKLTLLTVDLMDDSPTKRVVINRTALPLSEQLRNLYRSSCSALLPEY